MTSGKRRSKTAGFMLCVDPPVGLGPGAACLFGAQLHTHFRRRACAIWNLLGILEHLISRSIRRQVPYR